MFRQLCTDITQGQPVPTSRSDSYALTPGTDIIRTSRTDSNGTTTCTDNLLRTARTDNRSPQTDITVFIMYTGRPVPLPGTATQEQHHAGTSQIQHHGKTAAFEHRAPTTHTPTAGIDTKY